MMLTAFFIILVLLIFPSCEYSVKTEGYSSLTVISWNLQCFFDGDENGNEYSEFTQRYGWSRAKYNERIASTAELLRKSAYSSADVIFFQEVESARVLEDLLSAGLRRRGFLYYGVIEDNNPISVGFISKIKPFEVITHYADGQRPIMQVRFILDGLTFSVFNLHAKSNVGEDKENLRLRKQYARYLNTLLADNGDEHLLLLGDFNTELRLDTADLLASAEVIPADKVIEGHSLPVMTDSEMLSPSAFYDPLLDPALPFPGEGSYYYDDSWWLYDHILLSSALVAKSSLLEITILSDYTSDSKGRPSGYDTSIWRGYSDHFAIRLELGF